MISLSQVQINIVLSILLIVLLGHAYFNMNRKKVTNKLFLRIMGLTVVTLILEIISVILNNPNLKQFMVLHKLVNMLGFIVTPNILFLGYMFSKEWINRYHKEKIKLNYMLLLPLLINAIATLMSYNKNGLFYINSNNIYERGNLFFILPVTSYIYFVYSLYFIYKYRKRFTYSESVVFYLFFIVPAVFTGIQLRYSGYLTTWNSTAIIIVVIYILILNDQAYRDSLTGLGNRLYYEHCAHSISHKKLNKVFIIYIDIDEFKDINDKYGHHEGDKALKAFANLLVESFQIRQKKLIRLGGDEFLVLLEETKQEKVAEHIQNLTKNVKVYNTGEKLYKLKFSYGVVCYTNAYKNVYQLLEHADQLMYEQKQSKKSKLKY